MNCGIYKITNIVSGRYYIGSSRNITVRFRKHKSMLRGNYHDSKYLQNAWNKYGEQSFKFEVMLYCDPSNLIFYEQLAIDGFKAHFTGCGYNISPIAGSTKDLKLEDSCKATRKRKMMFKLSSMDRYIKSELRKIKVLSKSISRKIKIRKCQIKEMKKQAEKEALLAIGRKRKSHSEETKRKISASNLGKKMSEESKQKMSKIHKGKKLTEEQKEHLRVLNTGKKMSQEAIQKSVSTRRQNFLNGKVRKNRGQPQSQEHVQRRVESYKLAVQKRRESKMNGQNLQPTVTR